MADAVAANTDDERLQSLLGDVRYHRAMAVSSADNDPIREYHAAKMREALDSLRQIALAGAANENVSATAPAAPVTGHGET